MGNGETHDEEKIVEKLEKNSCVSCDKNESHENPKKNKSIEKKFNVFLLLLIILLLGVSFMYHIESLFENQYYFTHMSSLDREFSMVSERGLYYHYFKILVCKQTQSFEDASKTIDPSNIQYKYEYNHENIFNNIVDNIINDNRTEYPNTINALERFNLYPEVLSAMLYRLFYNINLLGNVDHIECYQIRRGEFISPNTRCNSIAQPIIFYRKIIFILNAFSFVFLFFICWLLNDYSIPAGLIGCLCYMYNNHEATRVSLSPGLREHFSYPFHMLQLVLITRELKEKKNLKSYVSLILTNLFYLLTWQFAQFSLATQTVAIYFTYILGYISLGKLVKVIWIHTISIILCFIFMFFNQMLLSSLFSSILISIWILIFLDYIFKRYIKIKMNFKFQLIYLITQIFSIFVLIIFVKKFLLPIMFIIDDDTHIWDLLKSKFSGFFGEEFHTFDTRLYLCDSKFGFMKLENIIYLSKTLLIPIVIVNLTYCAFIFLKMKMKYIEENDKPHGHLVYNIFQLGAFTLLAGFIMRLKILWIPHLCIIFSLIFNEIFSFINKFKASKYTIITVLIAIMTVQGIANLKKQHEYSSEYSNSALENFVNWVNTNTPENSSFTGSMQTMSNLKLSTNRAVVNHPHYENKDLRERARILLTYTYGYKDIKLLYNLLKKDKIDYLVIERFFCIETQNFEYQCRIPVMAHLDDNKEDKRTRDQPCALLLADSKKTRKYFQKLHVFSYLSVYKVL